MSTEQDLKLEVDRLRTELQALKLKSTISVGNYLLTRLAQLGVTVRTFSASDNEYQHHPFRPCSGSREILISVSS